MQAILSSSDLVGSYLRGNLMTLFSRLAPSVNILGARLAPPVSPDAPSNTAALLTRRRLDTRILFTANEVRVRFLAILPLQSGAVPYLAADILVAALTRRFAQNTSLPEMLSAIPIIAMAASISSVNLTIRGDPDPNSVALSTLIGARAGAAAAALSDLPAIVGGVGGAMGLVLLCGGVGVYMQLRSREQTKARLTASAAAAKGAAIEIGIVNPLSKYHFNTTTTSSVHELVKMPAASTTSCSDKDGYVAQKEWEEVVDGNAVLYKNTFSGELSWTAPADSVISPAVIIRAPYVVVLEGEVEYYRLSSGETVWQLPSNVLIPLWERVETDAREVWFRQTITGEVSWTEPEVVTPAADPHAAVAITDEHFWVRHADAEAHWYVNATDGRTEWDLPQGATLLTYEAKSDQAASWFVSNRGDLVWDLPEGAVLREATQT